ncbi:hypothetical protein [Amycolatopsis sp. YIM 10]|uniref:hypothetical protein n=1 Tax=Amycolatopsis sp. YIM 10 TaxID=2653857 RepID=UPI00128FCF8B|nr:hypothetical protein [Amycolatopsis sp. YIM 10]QFU93083.1 hypothetical protein YIM_39720 [Amycolatopsis sp. YIM 10]
MRAQHRAWTRAVGDEAVVVLKDGVRKDGRPQDHPAWGLDRIDQAALPPGRKHGHDCNGHGTSMATPALVRDVYAHDTGSIDSFGVSF